MQLVDLLQRGYFAKELPPPFVTNSFAAYAQQNAIVAVPRPRMRDFASRPCEHNLARPGNQRRRLAIPHPVNYYGICKVIEDNWQQIVQLIGSGPYSITKPTVDATGMRAAVAEHPGSELPLFRVRNRSAGRFILRTDISRWYHSIYTHSIPWAVLGKAAAKQQRTGGMGNDLDLHMRNSQDGQTMGIAIGPDASLIVAELLAAAMDKEIAARGLRGFRFMDDYEFVFTTRGAAEEGLAVVEQVLRNYELGTNTSKTYIDDLPQRLDREWTILLRNYVLPTSMDESELIKFFDLAFSLRKKYPYETVLGYAVSRLRSQQIDGAAWNTFEDILFQCILVEPGTIQAAMWHFERRHAAPSAKLSEVINTVITSHVALTHGSEVAWSLWMAIWFNQSIDDDTASALDTSSDAVIALLAMHAKSKGLIDQAITFPSWERLMTADSLHDGNWLLAYEADVKNWLPSADPTNHVDGDPNLGPLKAAGVYFYDENVQHAVNYMTELTDYPDPGPPEDDFWADLLEEQE